MATPPFFYAADRGALDQWLTHGLRMPSQGHQTIIAPERELFEAWRELSVDRKIFDIADLQEVIESRSGESRTHLAFGRRISNVCKRLAEAGVIWREKASAMGPGMGRSYIYTLRSPEETAARWVGGPADSQDNPEAPRKSKSEEAGPAEPTSSLDAERTYHQLAALGWFTEKKLTKHTGTDRGVDDTWTLHLISQLIERCSRTTSRENIEQMTSHIRLNDEVIEVEAARAHHRWESGIEHGIIAAEDSQLILAIITMAMQSIARDLKAGVKPPRNRVTFDLLELSKTLHPEGGRSGYRAFQKGMARIINTVYRLNKSGPTGGQRLTFRLIESVAEGEGSPTDCDDDTWTPAGASMRYFSFSLNTHIWNGLLRGQGWLVHPELLYERSGLIHRVYHHLRTNAGVDTPYRIEISDLAKWLVPAHPTNLPRARKRFRDDLKSNLQARAKRDSPLLASLGQPQEGEVGDALDETVALRLFDLDIRVRPSDRNPDGYILEAMQSQETLELLRRRNERLREMLGHQGDSPALTDSSGNTGGST